MAAARLRPAFLETLAEEAPGVLFSLRDDVLPVYSATHTSVDERITVDELNERYEEYERHNGHRAVFCHQSLDLTRWDTVGRAGDSNGVDWYPDLLELRHAVASWARAHCLDESWVCEASLSQLRDWHLDPEFAYPRSPYPRNPERTPTPGYLPWLYLGFQYSSSLWLDKEERLRFACEGWDPHLSTRSEAEARIRAAFESELRRHLEEVEEHVRNHGAFQPTRKWQDLHRYLCWLVRYQCRGESFAAIAASEYAKPHYQTVAVPVRQIAQLLGLPLRPPSRGRPRGRKDSYSRRRV